jgi:hypothetical protein
MSDCWCRTLRSDFTHCRVRPLTKHKHPSWSCRNNELNWTRTPAVIGKSKRNCEIDSPLAVRPFAPGSFPKSLIINPSVLPMCAHSTVAHSLQAKRACELERNRRPYRALRSSRSLLREEAKRPSQNRNDPVECGPRHKRVNYCLARQIAFPPAGELPRLHYREQNPLSASRLFTFHRFG